MSHARIGKIRLKTGGATLSVLHNPMKESAGKENWCGEVVKSARKIAEFSEPGSELCGFVVIGLYADGMHAMGLRLDETRCHVPKMLMPAYIAEIIRRDFITKDKFNDMFERRE